MAENESAPNIVGGTIVVGGSLLVTGAPGVAFLGKTKITQLLGKVRTNKGELLGTPIVNVTRWILDVQQDDAEIELELDFRYARKGINLRSYAFAPLSPAFWGAGVYLEERDAKIVLKAFRPSEYRLAIDTLHTSSR